MTDTRPSQSIARRLSWTVPPLVALLSLGACGGDGSGNFPDPGPGGEDQTVSRVLQLDESDMTAWASDGTLYVEVPVERLTDRELEVTGTLEFHDLGGSTIGSATGTTSLVGERGVILFETTDIADLPAGTIESGALADLVIRYELRAGSSRIFGRRSLFQAWRKQQIHVFSNDVFNVDGETFVRIVALDPADGAPLSQTEVALELQQESGTTALFAGVTDEFGVLTAPVGVTEEVLGDGELVVRVGGEAGGDTLKAAVRVERQHRIMITTDKPLYQPGQVIHIRTLTLNRPSLSPASERPVLFEIKDAEGNKVGRQELETNGFGVASMEFVLARELNMGAWTISATVDGVTTERTVTVERYVLPTFGVVVQPDREYYRPGDTAQLYIDSQYFFGEPVAGGSVLVEPYTFDVGFTPLPTIEATLNDDGIARVDVPVPEFLVGLPLEQGGTFLRVDVSVTDATEHTEIKSMSLPVADGDLLVTVIPRSSIVPGRENAFFVLTTTPTGRPSAAQVTLTSGAFSLDFETDERGLGEITMTPPAEARSVSFTLDAENEAGAVSRDFDFDTGFAADHGAIALLTDRAVYEAGESVEVSIVTGTGIPRVFLDVIRSGQTMLTHTVELESGRADYTLDLSADMVGTLQLDAYLVTTDANIVRGDALIYVEDANQLSLAFETDREEYRPGDDAVLDIRVTDEEGNGVVAAVGLSVVDEAVFALQDMRPGLERIYFQLEEELLEPQYNIYGWSFESVVAPGDMDDETRETTAEVILAAADAPGYGIALDSLSPALAAALGIAQNHMNTDRERVAERFRTLFDRGAFTYDVWEDIDAVRDVIDDLGTLYDPWGKPLEVAAVDSGGGWVNEIEVRSSGLDETEGTDDDIRTTLQTWELSMSDEEARGRDGGDWENGGPQAGGGGEGMDDGGFGPPMDAGAEPSADDPDMDGDGVGGADAPRVRSFFPETLLVEPSLITDADGTYSLDVSLADNITTWRMTGTANSATGELGSGTGGIRVFQEFFVDIDFPVQLTQHDVMGVPVAIFNFLDEAQTVEISVDAEESGDWFTLLSEPTIRVDLEPGEITVRYFDVEVDRVGWHPFQITALGTSMSDAVRRVVEVLPDGQEQLVVFSDRLVNDVTRTVTIPEDAIDDASNILVKLYPGLFSQVVEGLDSLLQMPSGCFEQTSSTTYPNVLVLGYLQETGQATPEMEMLATEYISQGYQRLVSFEVAGGGFEWFGNDPAHRILTTYGLMEFSDMANVFPVDPAVIQRTQEWLVSQQEPDGRFKAAPEGIHEGATNNFTDSDLRATAYVTYGLLYSGLSSSATDRGVAWVKSNLTGVDDPYTLGLVANMLLIDDPASAEARAVIDDLEDARLEGETDAGPIYWWESSSDSLYYGSGNSMHMEATALILQAYIRAGAYPATIDGVVGFLIANKDAFGNFSSTQATIQSLKAFLMMLSTATTSGAATISVFAGEALIDTVEIDEESSDLMRQFDLRDYVFEGNNDITIEIDGEGQFLYQIVGRYYLPWDLVGPSPSEEIVTIDVSYDRTSLEVDETVLVTATVQNRSDARLDMLMIDLGVPPGFDVQMSDFGRYIDDESIPVTRVERAGRQLTVYVYGLDPAESLVLDYHLRATMPMEARTPPSAVWLYYDSETRTESEPIDIEVM